MVLPTALALLLCNMDRICLRWDRLLIVASLGEANPCAACAISFPPPACSVAMLPIAKELGWAPGTQGVIQVRV